MLAIERVQRVENRAVNGRRILRVGTPRISVLINDHHRLDPASPWGGVDDSGVGRECGTESFDDHFNTKSVMVATHDAPFDWYRDTANQRRLN